VEEPSAKKAKVIACRPGFTNLQIWNSAEPGIQSSLTDSDKHTAIRTGPVDVKLLVAAGVTTGKKQWIRTQWW